MQFQRLMTIAIGAAATLGVSALGSEPPRTVEVGGTTATIDRPTTRELVDSIGRENLAKMASFVPDHEFTLTSGCTADSRTGIPIGRGSVNRNPWPDGEVYYLFSDPLIDAFDTQDPDDLNRFAIPNLLAVMLFIETETNVKFIGYDETVPAHFRAGYVLLEGEEDGGNAAAVGHIAAFGGSQFFNIEPPNWGSFSLILHELGHTMGLFHEHQRPGREAFVEVNIQHVVQEFASAFVIDTGAYPIGDYDFQSVMHYGRFAFSVNGLPTIDVRPPYETLGPCLQLIGEPDPVCGYENTIGQFVVLSAGDKVALANLYGFPGQPQPWFYDPTRRCATDVNLDGIVNAADLLRFIDLLRAANIRADLTLDRLFTLTDFLIFYNRWLAELSFCGGDTRPGGPGDRFPG